MSYLKIVTLNCGLMDITIMGLTVFSNPPYSQKRVKFIPQELIRINADIIALQECFNINHVKFIINELKEIYPYSSAYNTETFIKLSNGLIFLSKYPIGSSIFKQYNLNHPIENMFATKGYLICTINIPHIGSLDFINLHTTSFTDPPDENNKIILDYELKEILSLINSNTIILGDFNCGPNISTHNYNFLINNNNLIDVIGTFNKYNNLNLYTWDPNTILTKTGPHSHHSLSRIDHIMIHKDLFNYCKILNGEIIFKREIVPIDNNVNSTISDHFGILVELKFHNNI